MRRLPPRTDLPRGLGLVVGVQLVAAGLVAGWFATGHASAPDHGLQQIDLLMLDERVPGVEPVDGYVLVSLEGRVRYRTYDPGWADHGFEQAVLLDAIADEHAAHR